MATKRGRYARVATADYEDEDISGAGAGSGSGSGQTRASGGASARKELVETIANKMHAACWVGGAAFVMYYTDFWLVLLADDRVNRIALDISLLCGGAFMAIGFYLIVWLGYIKQSKYKWEVMAPRAVPTATGFGVIGVITFMVAFWPVWGLLTLPITILYLIGTLFLAHFIPLP